MMLEEGSSWSRAQARTAARHAAEREEMEMAAFPLHEPPPAPPAPFARHPYPPPASLPRPQTRDSQIQTDLATLPPLQRVEDEMPLPTSPVQPVSQVPCTILPSPSVLTSPMLGPHVVPSTLLHGPPTHCCSRRGGGGGTSRHEEEENTGQPA